MDARKVDPSQVIVDFVVAVRLEHELLGTKLSRKPFGVDRMTYGVPGHCRAWEGTVPAEAGDAKRERRARYRLRNLDRRSQALAPALPAGARRRSVVCRRSHQHKRHVDA